MNTTTLDPQATATTSHPVASREEWLKARTALLKKEKQFTHLRDELTAERLQLPWVKIDKDYIFDTTEGPRTLAELFKGRSQLFVYHFMYGPGWKEGCVGCSFLCDHLDGTLPHLENHDVTPVVVSHAPLPELLTYKERMGWKFDWVSSFNTDFNFDFNVSFTKEQIESKSVTYNFAKLDADMEELPGASAFYQDAEGNVFHTYSTFARGGENFLTTYMILDMMPKGRNEEGDLSNWVRHHDRYGKGGHVDDTGRYHEESPSNASATECGCSKD